MLCDVFRERSVKFTCLFDEQMAKLEVQHPTRGCFQELSGGTANEDVFTCLLEAGEGSPNDTNFFDYGCSLKI